MLAAGDAGLHTHTQLSAESCCSIRGSFKALQSCLSACGCVCICMSQVPELSDMLQLDEYMCAELMNTVLDKVRVHGGAVWLVAG